MSADGRPLICAHRGASAMLPDNSLAAFEAAIASGCDAIETDLRRRSDGRIVLAHDEADAHRKGVVDLGSLLTLADGRVQLDLELKEPGLERDLLAMIAEDRSSIVSSFQPGVLRTLRALSPELETGLIVEPPLNDDLTELAQFAGVSALMVHDSLLTADLLERAAHTGHSVWVWTVNDETRLAELIAEPLLAAVITDIPERALAIRQSLQPASQEIH
jgi:glycerophosphoryl diester phosphodiesterase